MTSAGISQQVRWTTSYEILKNVVQLNYTGAYSIPRFKATAILSSRHVQVDGYPAFRMMKVPLSKFNVLFLSMFSLRFVF